MFNDDDDYFLNNLLKREPEIIKKKENVDFPSEVFDSTLQNLLDMFQVEGKFECFKENLEKMRRLVSKFPSIIVSIFLNRNIFPFLIELLKTPNSDIQTNSLEITSTLIYDHEDIIKLYVENEVYPNILDFFFSENTPLILAVSKFFSYSIFESPSNFLPIFINDHLQALFHIYNILDKTDAHSRIVYAVCNLLYTLFSREINVDVEVLERVYQNILFDLYDRRFYIFFLQFVEAILQVTNRDHFNSNLKEKKFIKDFYETDFPLHVSEIFFNCFNSSGKIIMNKEYLKYLKKSLSVISDLFNKNRFIAEPEIDDFKTNIFTDITQNETLLKCVNMCFSIDTIFEENGNKLVDNHDEEEENIDEIENLINDIAIKAVNVFIAFVRLFKSDAVTRISNFRIISNFTDNPDNHSYSKKVALTELCLNILEYCSDGQFISYIDNNFSTPLFEIILENIDPTNRNHLKAFYNMLNSLPGRPIFSYGMLKNYYHFLAQIQDSIEENDPEEKDMGTSLTLFMLQIEKSIEEADGFDEEGQISDGDDQILDFE